MLRSPKTRADGFVVDQLFVAANPLTVPLWLAGLGFLLIAPAGRRYRVLGIMFVSAFVLLLVLRGRSYYLAAAYPMLIAAGSVAWQHALAPWRERPRRVATIASWLALVAGGSTNASRYRFSAPASP